MRNLKKVIGAALIFAAAAMYPLEASAGPTIKFIDSPDGVAPVTIDISGWILPPSPPFPAPVFTAQADSATAEFSAFFPLYSATGDFTPLIGGLQATGILLDDATSRAAHDVVSVTANPYLRIDTNTFLFKFDFSFVSDLTGNGLFDLPSGVNSIVKDGTLQLFGDDDVIRGSLAQLSDFNLSVYVKTNVPEPATVALFGAGLIGLVAVGRRRRKAAK